MESYMYIHPFYVRILLISVAIVSQAFYHNIIEFLMAVRKSKISFEPKIRKLIILGH
jgi:hypothetical protein